MSTFGSPRNRLIDSPLLLTTFADGLDSPLQWDLPIPNALEGSSAASSRAMIPMAL